MFFTLKVKKRIPVFILRFAMIKIYNNRPNKDRAI